jgi:hypothetical protein
MTTDAGSIHRRFEGFVDDELRRIPIGQEGALLDEGATYIDLNAMDPYEFTATRHMTAGRDNWYVPKARVPYNIWTRLTGDEDKE